MRRSLICAALVGLLLGVLALWGSNKQALGLFHDDGIYVVVAKSLDRGEGYRIISLPGSPPQTKYPFFYSYLLSWVWWVNPKFPQNIIAFKALNATILVGIFFLCLLFYRRSVASHGFGAVICSILVCANPIIFTFTDYLISDLLFVLLALTVLTICAKGIADSPLMTLPGIAFLAVLSGLALLSRSAAVPLVLAGALFSFKAQRWQGLGIFAAVVGLFIAPWLLWVARYTKPSADSLFAYYSAYDFVGAASANFRDQMDRQWSVVAGNARYLTDSFEMLYLTPLLPGLGMFVGALTVLGFLKSFSEKELVNWSFFLSSLLLLVFWPFHPGRYVAPLTPLLVLYFFRGAQTVERWVARALCDSGFKPSVAKLAWTPLTFVLAFMSMWLAGFLLVRDDQSTRGLYGNRVPYGWDGFDESFTWIRAHTPADALLATAYDPMYYLYTGRRAIRPALHRPASYFYPYGQANADVGSIAEIKPQLDELKANYLIIDPLDGYAERKATLKLLDQLIIAYGGKAKNVFTSTDGKHRIYELLRN